MIFNEFVPIYKARDASAPGAATAWETPDLAVCGHSDAVITKGRVLRRSPRPIPPTIARDDA